MHSVLPRTTRRNQIPEVWTNSGEKNGTAAKRCRVSEWSSSGIHRPNRTSEVTGAAVGPSREGRHHEATERQTQERDIKGQKGAQAGHAGGKAAGGHSGVAHSGCGSAAHRALCLRGH